MARNEAVERIIDSLAFEVEAVPQDNILEVSGASHATPLNLKIRVRKKDEALFKQGVVSVPKLGQPKKSSEKIRLVSSDQTVLSFKVFVDTEPEKKPLKKRKRFFGGCLSSEDNDDDSYTESNVATKSSEIVVQNFGLSKNVQDMQLQTRKPTMFFGNTCKPGGCLDPPFGEDKYSYEPKEFSVDNYNTETKIVNPVLLTNTLPSKKSSITESYKIESTGITSTNDNNSLKRSILDMKSKNSFQTFADNNNDSTKKYLYEDNKSLNKDVSDNKILTKLYPEEKFPENIQSVLGDGSMAIPKSDDKNNIEAGNLIKDKTIGIDRRIDAPLLDEQKMILRSGTDETELQHEPLPQVLQEKKTSLVSALIKTGVVATPLLIGGVAKYGTTTNKESDDIQSKMETASTYIENDTGFTTPLNTKENLNMLKPGNAESEIQSNEINDQFIHSEKEKSINSQIFGSVKALDISSTVKDTKKSDTSVNDNNYPHLKPSKTELVPSSSKDETTLQSEMDVPTNHSTDKFIPESFNLVDASTDDPTVMHLNDILNKEEDINYKTSDIMKNEPDKYGFESIHHKTSTDDHTTINLKNILNENEDENLKTHEIIKNESGKYGLESTDHDTLADDPTTTTLKSVLNKTGDVNKTLDKGDIDDNNISDTNLDILPNPDTQTMEQDTNISDKIRESQTFQDIDKIKGDINSIDFSLRDTIKEENILFDNQRDSFKDTYDADDINNIKKEFVPGQNVDTNFHIDDTYHQDEPTLEDSASDSKYLQSTERMLNSKDNQQRGAVTDSIRDTNVDNNIVNDLQKQKEIKSRESGSIDDQLSMSMRLNQNTDKITDKAETGFPKIYSTVEEKLDSSSRIHFSKTPSLLDESKLISRKDSIFMDLAFHSFKNNKNGNVIKTLDTLKNLKRQPQDNITIIKSQLRPTDAIKVPIDTDVYMMIEIKKTDQLKPSASRTPTAVVSNLDNNTGKSTKVLAKQTQSDRPDLETFQNLLSTVYEKQLIPLQHLISDLRKDVDMLASQQLWLKENWRRTKKSNPKLTNTNRKCLCYRKCN